MNSEISHKYYILLDGPKRSIYNHDCRCNVSKLNVIETINHIKMCLGQDYPDHLNVANFLEKYKVAK